MKFYFIVLLAGASIIPKAEGLQDEPASPKASRFHQFLKQFEGTWEGKAKFWIEPDKPPVESTAVETATLRCNGLWLVYSDKGELFGKPYEGYGMLGYDDQKRKFVGSWVDQMSTSLDLAEGMCDEKGRLFTLVSEASDSDGKPTRIKRVTEFRDKDTQLMTIYQGPKGEETVTGKVELRRKK